MLKIGANEIKNVYLGSAEIKKAYVGTDLVFDTTPSYTVTVSIDPAKGGTVSGAGTYLAGETVTLKAVPSSGYQFTAWQVNGSSVGTGTTYSFIASGNVTVTAVFAVKVPQLGAWHGTSNSNAGKWVDIAYGNGRFVAVAEGDSTILYSTNGSSWGKATLPSYSYLSCVTYGGDKFVALPNSSSKTAFYSTNGTSWTAVTMTKAVTWASITYGNGKFVAVSSSKGTAGYSTDGINWTLTTLPSSSSGTWTVTYGNGIFVAVIRISQTGGTIAAYSLDGITWHASTLPATAFWKGITYGNGKFVAFSSGSSWQKNSIAYSTDGINWKLSSPLLNVEKAPDWSDIAYGGGLFVIVENNATSSGGRAAYSTDGIHWTSLTLPHQSTWRSIAYGNGRFVTLCYDSSYVAYADIV